MSAQNMHDAFAPWEAAYKAKVMAATWGHLAPKRGKTYRGSVTFALGCLGNDSLNPVVLHFDFGGLNSSPWLYDALIDFLQELRSGDEYAGHVYRFDGTFCNYEFKGTVRLLLDAQATR